MDPLDLLIDLHRDASRQGPGGPDETRLSITLSGLKREKALKIADIGCGSGASTLVLAEELDANITAVDFAPEFLERLDISARREGVQQRIKTLVASMESLPFEEESLDGIWSEGAIYNMGFEAGIKDWRRFLKPAGVLAVSELTWLTGARPAELERYWEREYPEVATASAKMAILEENGYSPIGFFPLSERCWLENYYRPTQARFADFLARHDHSNAARAVVEAEMREISLFERFSAYFGYGYFVANRTADTGP